MNRCHKIKKVEFLNDLFSNNGLGIISLRISIGPSDLNAEPFLYNDLENGKTNINLDKFLIERDKKNLIPILKRMKSINPMVKIMASPWSPPVWMKTNNSTIGG